MIRKHTTIKGLTFEYSFGSFDRNKQQNRYVGRTKNTRKITIIQRQ
jgi:hypothetical protein